MDNEQAEVSCFTSPDKLSPMDRDQFAFVFQLANSAGALTMPVENPQQFGINIEGEDDETATAIRFTDVPINRALFAAKQHYGKDTASFFNFSTRFFAMFDVIKSEQIRKWTREDESDSRITLLHPAVIYVGAEARLDGQGRFDLTEFFNSVEKIAPEIDVDEL